MNEKRKGLVIDLGEEKKLSLWQIIQLIMVCVALGAGFTLVNSVIGFVLVGTAIIVLAMPLIHKILGGVSHEEP